MLNVHFTLSETADNPYLATINEGFTDRGQEVLVKTQIEEAMEAAIKSTYDELCGRHPWNGSTAGVEPYNTDSGRPFLHFYVGEFQRDGGLDCAHEWHERYKGQGVHVALVIEGKPSGPVYATRNADGTYDPGVLDGDFDRTVVDTFAKYLVMAVEAMVPGYRIDPDDTYTVCDWSLNERQSVAYPIPALV